MKLHDLQVGQRFSFIDKHRGKTFEVTQRAPRAVHYADTATGEERMATDSAKAFRMEVELVTTEKVFTFSERELLVLYTCVQKSYLHACEEGASESVKSEINALYCKLTGSAGRRVVRPEGE